MPPDVQDDRRDSIGADHDREDPILAELERTREEILAEFGGDFEAFLDYLDTREADNRRRGLRYALPPARDRRRPD